MNTHTLQKLFYEEVGYEPDFYEVMRFVVNRWEEIKTAFEVPEPSHEEVVSILERSANPELKRYKEMMLDEAWIDELLDSVFWKGTAEDIISYARSHNRLPDLLNACTEEELYDSIYQRED